MSPRTPRNRSPLATTTVVRPPSVSLRTDSAMAARPTPSSGDRPAGTEKEGTGHHHILVDRAPWGDGADDAESAKNGLPADNHHKHFGGGQTETTLDLAPGTHTLQLVVGDAFHVPHDPAVASEVITITVK